jgi:hypothetical protein
MTLIAGTRPGPYEIESALGAGGMGEVYRARDRRLDRIVAIKVLPDALATDPQFRERFDREARAISQLDHPHICALHDVGEEQGTSFLVMQYLEGETLAARLTKGSLPLNEALALATQTSGPRHLSGLDAGWAAPDLQLGAYEANDSGQFEIWVRPYPDVTRGHWQVSTGGGARPLWAPNGKELFYLSPTGALMRVGVERSSTWTATSPTKLLSEGYFAVPGGFQGRTYDISPDGQRFLMIKQGAGSDQTAGPPSLVVVQNWGEELKRLVPTR